MNEPESDRVTVRDHWRVAYPDGKYEYFDDLLAARDWMEHYFPVAGSTLEHRTITEVTSYSTWQKSEVKHGRS